MEFAHEKREALRLLRGLEEGSMSTVDVAYLIQDADPALVYFLITWLRKTYGAGHPAAEGVIGRVVKLLNEHREVKKILDEGKQDPIIGWFEDAHAYRDFDASEFVSLIVEKLEG